MSKHEEEVPLHIDELEMAEQKRSTFVTVVAWISIALSGFATFFSLTQYFVVESMFNDFEMAEVVEMQGAADEFPFLMRLTLSHIEIFVFIIFCITLIWFISSIGLLKRYNWARRLIVSLLSLGIIWNIGSFGLHLLVFSQMSKTLTEFGSFMLITVIANIIFIIALCGLLGFIVIQLCSFDIRQEFEQ